MFIDIYTFLISGSIHWRSRGQKSPSSILKFTECIVPAFVYTKHSEVSWLNYNKPKSKMKIYHDVIFSIVHIIQTAVLENRLGSWNLDSAFQAWTRVCLRAHRRPWWGQPKQDFGLCPQAAPPSHCTQNTNACSAWLNRHRGEKVLLTCPCLDRRWF